MVVVVQVVAEVRGQRVVVDIEDDEGLKTALIRFGWREGREGVESGDGLGDLRAVSSALALYIESIERVGE